MTCMGTIVLLCAGAVPAPRRGTALPLGVHLGHFVLAKCIIWWGTLPVWAFPSFLQGHVTENNSSGFTFTAALSLH